MAEASVTGTEQQMRQSRSQSQRARNCIQTAAWVPVSRPEPAFGSGAGLSRMGMGFASPQVTWLCKAIRPNLPAASRSQAVRRAGRKSRGALA